MTAEEPVPMASPLGPLARYEQNVIDRITDFNDPRQEWRRLFSELLGTFFLVLVAAGGGMMGAAFPDMISRTAAVTAPGLMVMGIILFMGKVSGAHLNPAVSVAFALRRDFPWGRVPGYIIVQLIGATLAALVLHAVINVSAATVRTTSRRATPPGPVLDGADLDLGPGQRDPGDRLGRPEHRHHRRVRGRRVHRPGRAVGKPDLRSVDEPGPHVRARSGRGHLHQLLGLHRRADRGRRASPSASPSSCAAAAAACPARGPPKVTCTPRPTRPANPEDRDMFGRSSTWAARQSPMPTPCI